MNAANSTAVAPKEPMPKRFDVYVIDTGWNKPMSAVLKSHLKLFETYLVHLDNCYVLDEHQSVEILKVNPQLIGKDPVLVVVDTDAMVEKRRGGHGFRFCLGKAKTPAKAENLLRLLLQIILDNEKSQNVNKAVQKFVHKKGLDGAIEMIAKSAGRDL